MKFFIYYLYSMAKIFSPIELRYRQIPIIEDFNRIAEMIVEQASPEPVDDPIEVMVYGSVESGNQNIRSDLDCLIIWPDDLSVVGINKYLEWLRDVSRPVHIPIEPIAIRKGVAQKGQHGIDNLFREYLLSLESKSRLKQGNPAAQLAEQDRSNSPSNIVHNFASAKTAKFTKASMFTEINYSTFQRSLELVRALDRKIARIPGLSNETNTLLKLANYLNLNDDINNIINSTMYLNNTNTDYDTALRQALSTIDFDEENTIKEYQTKIELWYPRVLESAITLSIGAHAVLNAATKKALIAP
jgi:hypothetical protein